MEESWRRETRLHVNIAGSEATADRISDLLT
jgi:hypothetical protein